MGEPAQAKSEGPFQQVASQEDEAAIQVIQGRDEFLLMCGKSSIPLRRNSKTIIKGLHVETHSEGINRIRGGSIQFN